VSVQANNRQDWRVDDYALGETLESGQAFGWDRDGEGWTGVVAGRWVRLSQCDGVISAEVAEPVTEWGWIESYLDLHEDLGSVLATFPQDGPLGESIAACRGLRLLRQDPWECLAGFICSSTKQIVQIRQIVRNLRERYGAPVVTPEGVSPAFAFPSVEAVAALDESALRACKLGFRAPYLLGAARRVAEGRLDLAAVSRMGLEEARVQLMELSGVGRKVADCALLFGFGHRQAFPVDVWVRAALTRLYFPRARKVTARRIEEFSASYFGANGGYAQQYLFHYVRTRLGRAWAAGKVAGEKAPPVPIKAARARRP
jgi:N-glycosylase/DNA lyase